MPATQPGLFHEHRPTLTLFPYQREAVDAILAAYRGGTRRPALSAATGCHRAGQRILMWNGDLKPVEEIVHGDLLMGPDSHPREVLELIRGHDEMVRIVPTKGQPWVVNRDHVLTLQRTRKHADDPLAGEIIDVSVRAYQTWSDTRKHLYKLFRVPVDFGLGADHWLPPYDLGMILGDGLLTQKSRLGVSKPDPEIRDACETLAARFGLELRTENADGDRCPTHWFVQAKGKKGGHTWGGNGLIATLTDLGLHPIKSAHRFIPRSYKITGRDDRLQLLAGLLDTDGHLGHSGFDYGTKSEQLANDVVFVARSLGFAAYLGERGSGPGKGQYRVSISGDLSLIPTRIPRKQAAAREQIKSVLRTGFTIEPASAWEPYYGFTLDGDGRYLLDDFTVTHNSGKTVMFSKLIEESGERSLVIAHRKEIIEQAAQKVGYVLDPADVGIVMAERNQYDAPVVVASIQTIADPRRLERLGPFGLVVVDEAHHAASPSYVTTLARLGVSPTGPTKALGVSATWDRADGLGFDAVFEAIVYTIGIEQLIASGHLSDVRALLIETHLDTRGVPGNGAGDFNAEALSRRIVDSDYADTLAAAVVEHAADRTCLVFAPNVRTAGLFRDALRAVGIAAEMVSGETPRHERERIVADLRAGRLRAVVNCGVFTEGTDIPNVDCVVMGRPTKSRALYQQMAGRGLRRYPGKTDCLILDLVGNAERLDLQSAASLVGRQANPNRKQIASFREWLAEPEEATLPGAGEVEVKGELGKPFQQRAKAVELIDRSKLAWAQIDLSKAGLPVFSLPLGDAGQIVLQDDAQGAFSVVRFGRDRTREVLGEHLDIGYAQGVAEHYAMEAGARLLVDPNASWRKNNVPATEKQKAALAKWKIPFADDITKVEASELLDKAITKANLRRRNWQGVA